MNGGERERQFAEPCVDVGRLDVGPAGKPSHHERRLTEPASFGVEGDRLRYRDVHALREGEAFPFERRSLVVDAVALHDISAVPGSLEIEGEGRGRETSTESADTSKRCSGRDLRDHRGPARLQFGHVPRYRRASRLPR